MATQQQLDTFREELQQKIHKPELNLIHRDDLLSIYRDLQEKKSKALLDNKDESVMAKAMAVYNVLTEFEELIGVIANNSSH